ncbi:hypothetical protein DOK67_0000168 [Enterococcus sp. DIV0212c]
MSQRHTKLLVISLLLALTEFSFYRYFNQITAIDYQLCFQIITFIQGSIFLYFLLSFLLLLFINHKNKK